MAKYKIVWKANKERTVPIYQGRYFSSEDSARTQIRRNLGGKKMTVEKVKKR